MLPKIDQLELKFPKDYLCSITKIIEITKDDWAIYEVNIYRNSCLEGFTERKHPINVGSFEVSYMGNKDLYFTCLKQGIDKIINKNQRLMVEWSKKGR